MTSELKLRTFTARHVTTARLGGSIRVFDANTGQPVGQVDLVRGFACYTGIRGSAHEGASAVIRGGMPGLVQALAEGIRNGRDDRA